MLIIGRMQNIMLCEEWGIILYYNNGRAAQHKTAQIWCEEKKKIKKLKSMLHNNCGIVLYHVQRVTERHETKIVQ